MTAINSNLILSVSLLVRRKTLRRTDNRPSPQTAKKTSHGFCIATDFADRLYLIIYLFHFHCILVKHNN